jgi:phthiocerol/phenolphthiocerol synthesis type-I polyketide synthase E
MYSMRLASTPLLFDLPNGMTAFGLNETDTLTVYRDIFDDDCYRKHGVTIEAGDSIIDVGANTGLFALFLNELGIKLRVLAFEPAPATFEVLRQNAATCGNLDVELFNVGLGRTTGYADFTYYPRFSNASTFYPDESPEAVRRGQEYILDLIPTLPPWLAFICRLLPHFLQVPIVEVIRRYHLKKEIVRCDVWNLSEFLQEHELERVDLLKIDAEQSEEEILAGISENDWPKIRQVIVEVHGGIPATQRLADLFKRHGFRTAVDPNPAMPSLSLVYGTRPGPADVAAALRERATAGRDPTTAAVGGVPA